MDYLCYLWITFATCGLPFTCGLPLLPVDYFYYLRYLWIAYATCGLHLLLVDYLCYRCFACFLDMTEDMADASCDPEDDDFRRLVEYNLF